MQFGWKTVGREGGWGDYELEEERLYCSQAGEEQGRSDYGPLLRQGFGQSKFYLLTPILPPHTCKSYQRPSPLKFNSCTGCRVNCDVPTGRGEWGGGGVGLFS